MVHRTPGIGQEAFPGMPEPPVIEPAQAPYDPERKRAFGSIPRILGVTVETVGEEIDPRGDRLISPWYVNTTLYGARGGYSVSGLAVNEAEYELLVRWPKAFSEAIEAKTEGANQEGVNHIRYEEKRIKSVLEAYRSKLPLHEAALAGLVQDTDNLREAQKVAAAPGYSLVKPKQHEDAKPERYTELDLQIMFTRIWEGDLPNLLKVVSQQHRWNEEEKALAETALKSQLFAGPQQERVRFWKEKMQMAYMYGMRRRALFAQRTHKVQTEIGKRERDLAKLYETHGITPN